MLGFIFWPLLKVIWRIAVQAHRINRFMRDPSSFFTGNDSGNARKKKSKEEKPQRSKKFGKDVGEYVDFTDVSCNVGDNATEVAYVKEEQVTDIEWVDIEEDSRK